MTHEEEQQRARELLESVAADAMKNAPVIDNAHDLLAMIAEKLRDEPDVIEPLRDRKLTALALIQIHDLGKASRNSNKHSGVVGVSFLAFTDNPAPIDLLNTMHNTDETALALITHQTADDGDEALLIIAAKDESALLVGVGETNGDRNSGAFSIPRDDLATRAPLDADHSLKLFTALLNAAGRRAQ